MWRSPVGILWYVRFYTCFCACSVSQLCLAFCDPMDSSPPGSSVHGISQARILEWVAISYSRGPSRPRDRTCISPALAGGFFTTEPEDSISIPEWWAVLSGVAQSRTRLKRLSSSSSSNGEYVTEPFKLGPNYDSPAWCHSRQQNDIQFSSEAE